MIVAAVILGAAGVWGVLQWRDAVAEADALQARQARERRDQEREEREIEGLARLQEESAGLIPPLIEPVALGMPRDEVRRHRPRTTPKLDGQDPVLDWLEERFPNGAQALYGFSKRNRRLVQVQILSLLPSGDAIAPHLVAMNEQYGRPTGIWDCPDTGGVPTRRFTWRKSQTTVADVFLIYRGRVSVTLYIAPSEWIHASLLRASCRPTTQEALDDFPVTTEDQMAASQGGGRPGQQKAPAKRQPVIRANTP
jgi:hypothetical protein